jgi:hypothetical protein
MSYLFSVILITLLFPLHDGLKMCLLTPFRSATKMLVSRFLILKNGIPMYWSVECKFMVQLSLILFFSIGYCRRKRVLLYEYWTFNKIFCF